MKKIYIFLVELPTLANKITYILSGFKNTHCSISLDNKFTKLYSFQVRNKKTPFVGGLMEENESFFFHGKKNIELNEIIFEVPITDKDYLKIEKYIKRVKNDPEYIFNYVSGLFMFIFGGIKVYKSYHCCEFISEILNMIDGINLPKKPHKMHPKDLYQFLLKYKYTSKTISSNDYKINDKELFFKELKKTSVIKKTLYTITESIIRAIKKSPRKNYNYRMTNYYKEDIK